MDHDDETGPAIMHIMYSLLVSVLLFNLLIAVFSNSYAHVWQNRNLIMTIQRLSLLFTIEKRFRRVFSKLYDYLDRFSFNRHGNGYFITIYEMANSVRLSVRSDLSDRKRSLHEKRYSLYKHDDSDIVEATYL